MKTLSLKLDDEIFEEAELITSESRLTSIESMNILHEFEMLLDDN